MQTKDKGSYEPLDVASKGLKAAGVTICSLGVGKHVNQGELQSMASHRNFVLQAKNFDGLEEISVEIRSQLCKGIVHVSNVSKLDIRNKLYPSCLAKVF